MMENTRRNAYDAAFKLKAINLAVEVGNRAAARKLGVAESMVRRWKQQREELTQCKKTTKAFRGNKSRWPELENLLEDWVNTQRADGRGVSTEQIRLKAKTIATEKKIEDFRGGPSWCLRFMRRKCLSIRAPTILCLQLPPDYEERVTSLDFRGMEKLSAAEKQRLYRQRRDADPTRRVEYLAKQRQGYVNDILTQKRKKVGDLSERARSAQRKEWRIKQARHRHRARTVLAVLTPLSSPERSPPHIPRQQQRGGKICWSKGERRPKKIQVRPELEEKLKQVTKQCDELSGQRAEIYSGASRREDTKTSENTQEEMEETSMDMDPAEKALPFAAGVFIKKEPDTKFSQGESEPGSWYNSMALSTANENSTFNQGDTQVERETLTAPLFQYWHITTACSKEISQIQRSNGVYIKDQASISIMAPASAEAKSSLLRGKEEFTRLFQKHGQDISSITVSITSLDQQNTMEILKEIQTEDCKLVLSVSSNGCTLSGPKESLDKFQRKWGLESCQWDSKEILHKTLELDLQEPLEKRGLSMDLFHWEFINKVFEEQVMAIKQKFGMDFSTEPAAGMVNVKAVPARDQKLSLTRHALRDLEQLYQKAATDILTCPLENPTHITPESIKAAFETVRRRHPYVAAGEANGPWSLVGLAEHLWPAVADVEYAMGEAVFSKEAKMHLRRPESSPTASGGAAVKPEGVSEDERCPICMDPFKDKSTLKCTHEFCSDCLSRAVESMGPCCPLCKVVFGKMEGNQPGGKMTFKKAKYRLPGYSNCGTIEIDYDIPSGVQTEKHPNPGIRFRGAQRRAYLPDNSEGNEVLRLLERAFEQKLIFTVGTSITTGATNTVTWNDIHHKTSTDGGPQSFGYPDPWYLQRVKEELKAKGIE